MIKKKFIIMINISYIYVYVYFFDRICICILTKGNYLNRYNIIYYNITLPKTFMEKSLFLLDNKKPLCTRQFCRYV